MVTSNESPKEEVDLDTDATFRKLETPAQRSAALRIHQLAGKFPWQIVDFCTETKWDVKLLDKIITLIITCFPGKLTDPDIKRLRSAIFQQIEPKPIKKRMCLLQSDIHEAQRELKRSTAPQPTPTTKTKRSLSVNQSPRGCYKRFRSEEPSPPTAATRASRRLKGEPTDTPTGELRLRRTVGGINARVREERQKVLEAQDLHNRRNADTEDGQLQNDTLNATPVNDQDGTGEAGEQSDDGLEAVDNLEDNLDDADTSAGYHDKEEMILVPTPRPRTRVDQTSPETTPSSSNARAVFFAEFSMTDKEIADKFRENVSSITSRLHFVDHRKLKDLEAVHQRCQQEYEKACDFVETLGAQLRQVSIAHGNARKGREKTDFKREKTATALASYQELEAAGDSDTQILAMLKAAFEQAESNHRTALKSCSTLAEKVSAMAKERDEAAKSAVSAKAELEDAEQRKINFQQKIPAERKFHCTIQMATNDGSDDGCFLADLTFDFWATGRQQ
ncbi:hypothetical protein FLONG3_652 [Fusarium longipes]|uniref:Uncharacterized protein n=1 Tax=Fusarium longipes TaxID=694270 RepID=A0A395T966_9HYPO|nr:hypothetical protein FLONG3_652 [Fusarium longipes]